MSTLSDGKENALVSHLSDLELMEVVAERAKHRHYKDALVQALQAVDRTAPTMFMKYQHTTIKLTGANWRKFLLAFVEAYRPDQYSIRAIPPIELPNERIPRPGFKQVEPDAGWPPQ